MNTFFCADCNITFEDNQGLKKEYRDYIGLCWKYIAHCPQCNSECSEKRAPKPGKAKSSSIPMCGNGGCSGGSCGMF
jgi:hypothetical protein